MTDFKTPLCTFPPAEALTDLRLHYRVLSKQEVQSFQTLVTTSPASQILQKIENAESGLTWQLKGLNLPRWQWLELKEAALNDVLLSQFH